MHFAVSMASQSAADMLEQIHPFAARSALTTRTLAVMTDQVAACRETTMVTPGQMSRNKKHACAAACVAMLACAGLAIASIFSSAADAADMTAPLAFKAAAPVATPYDWTGFYVGGHLGYA